MVEILETGSIQALPVEGSKFSSFMQAINGFCGTFPRARLKPLERRFIVSSTRPIMRRLKQDSNKQKEIDDGPLPAQIEEKP